MAELRQRGIIPEILPLRGLLLAHEELAPCVCLRSPCQRASQRDRLGSGSRSPHLV